MKTRAVVYARPCQIAVRMQYRARIQIVENQKLGVVGLQLFEDLLAESPLGIEIDLEPAQIGVFSRVVNTASAV